MDSAPDKRELSSGWPSNWNISSSCSTAFELEHRLSLLSLWTWTSALPGSPAPPAQLTDVGLTSLPNCMSWFSIIRKLYTHIWLCVICFSGVLRVIAKLIITLTLYVKILNLSCQETGLRSWPAGCAGLGTTAGCSGLPAGLSPRGNGSPSMISLELARLKSTRNNIPALRAGIYEYAWERGCVNTALKSARVCAPVLHLTSYLILSSSLTSGQLPSSLKWEQKLHLSLGFFFFLIIHGNVAIKGLLFGIELSCQYMIVLFSFVSLYRQQSWTMSGN